MVKADADKLVARLAQMSGGGDKLAATLSAEDLKSKGSDYYKAGQLTLAGSFYKQAITASPNLAEAHNNLGLVLRKRNRMQGAVAALQTALMLKPRSGSTYANLANLDERYGNIAQAEEYYLKSVELEPGIFQPYVGLARIATQRHRWDDALAALTRASAIAPQSTEILYQVGVVNLYKGDVRTALNSLRNAEGLAPKNPDIKASLAEALFQQGKDSEAEDALKACFDLDPENALGRHVQEKRSKERTAATEENTEP